MRPSDAARKMTVCAASLAAGAAMSGCVTSRVEETRQVHTDIDTGEAVVVLARRSNPGYETETALTKCVSNALARGNDPLPVRPEQEFLDGMFPWFEPRQAPTTAEQIPQLLSHPGVADQIAANGVRYVVWIDGETQVVDGGGNITCTVSAGVGGCFGFQWWEKDSSYEASVWDLKRAEKAGTISADVSGTSFMPAIIIPIPMMANTRSKACDGLATQLRDFLLGST